MIDWDKPVQTKDGKPVKIRFTDGRGKFCIVGYIGDEKGVDTWTKEGRYIDCEDSPLDLENLPEEREGWVNIYSNLVSDLYSTKDEADRNGMRDRTACIKVKYKEGEGL